MNWFYYACNRCNTPIHTTLDNPDFNIECVICEHDIFHPISKKEYKHAKPEEVIEK
jgi:DNA-directed RNA polymerase subunit RPC12/RpoP